MDVWALAVARYGIRILARYPGVRVLDEAEAGQGDQDNGNEALHNFSWLRRCDGRMLPIRKSWKAGLDIRVLGEMK